jgi:hypothetical protein
MKQSFTVILAIAFCLTAGAATIWNGSTTSFTKADGTDGTSAADQDRLTPNVWITRGLGQGLFNAAEEILFTHSLSPTNTEWADGLLADYATLSYMDWDTWVHANGRFGPPATVGVDAVVHLISDDIYLSIRFTSWSQHPGAGGFSYVRSTHSASSPPLVVNMALTNGVVSLTYNTAIGKSYIVQRSLDLINWTSIITNVASSNPGLFSENASGGVGFYRVARSTP